MLEDQIIFGMYYNDIIMYQSYYVCIMSVCTNPFLFIFLGTLIQTTN